jgi:hypothetical protein
MSRPLKLKVTGTVLCSVFQLPDHGFIRAVCGGAPQTFSALPDEELCQSLLKDPAYGACWSVHSAGLYCCSTRSRGMDSPAWHFAVRERRDLLDERRSWVELPSKR